MNDQLDRMNEAIGKELSAIREKPLQNKELCRKIVLGEDFDCKCLKCQEKQ